MTESSYRHDRNIIDGLFYTKSRQEQWKLTDAAQKIKMHAFGHAPFRVPRKATRGHGSISRRDVSSVRNGESCLTFAFQHVTRRDTRFSSTFLDFRASWLRLDCLRRDLINTTCLYTTGFFSFGYHHAMCRFTSWEIFVYFRNVWCWEFVEWWILCQLWVTIARCRCKFLELRKLDQYVSLIGISNIWPAMIVRKSSKKRYSARPNFMSK